MKCSSSVSCCIVGILLITSTVADSSIMRTGLRGLKKGSDRSDNDNTSTSHSKSGSRKKVGPPKEKNDSKSGKKLAHTTRRMTLRARTTLLNDQEMNCLGPDEAIFFEDTWKAAYKLLHTNNNDEEEDEAMDIRSVVMEDEPPLAFHDPTRRKLRGGYYQGMSVYQNKEEKGGLRPSQMPSPSPSQSGSPSISPATNPTPTLMPQPQQQAAAQNSFFFFFAPVRYFDIWSLIEFTCFLCSSDRRLEDSMGGDDATYKEMNSRFEILLGDMLREGPYECFRDIQGCQVTFVSV